MIRFTTAGESHGPSIVAILEGLPSSLSIDVAAINRDLARRQGGYGRGGRMKIEHDAIEILSGVRHGATLGSPIAVRIANRDFQNWQQVMSIEPADLDEQKARRVTRPRPGHADLAGGLKYNAGDLRDILERASARETAMRVAVGGFAKQLLRTFDIQIASHTVMLGGIPSVPIWDTPFGTIAAVPEDSPLRCVDSEAERQMIAKIDEVKKAGDTLGGIFEVAARGVPPGLGSHTQWDLKLDGRLAQALMSIQAVKAVEIGAGVSAASKPGSEIHDEIGYNESLHRFTRASNRAGGIEGGISNGEEIRVRATVKPIPTLRKPLKSIDIRSKESFEAAFERSDITVVPAAGVIGEAMTALVLADAFTEKFGGDSLVEVRRNYEGYLQQLREY